MVRTKRKKQAGFTLIEMLIVVLLLGILAMLIIPQISVSTDDAMLNTLQSNLGSMRNAVELYYHQHTETYPGENDITGTATADAAASATAFLQQLTRYTDINGAVSAVKTATHIYGPYLKAVTLPTNPYNNDNTVVCDPAEDDITVRASAGTAGWRFYPQTGVLMANDGGHDTL
ncbi:MAG: type II secretion system protein [Desulfobacterales bacterium]|jgi:general secretion pathway protein G